VSTVEEARLELGKAPNSLGMGVQGVHPRGAIKVTGPATRMRWRTAVPEVRGWRVVWRA
jgi:hypothetical protein